MMTNDADMIEQIPLKAHGILLPVIHWLAEKACFGNRLMSRLILGPRMTGRQKVKNPLAAAKEARKVDFLVIGRFIIGILLTLWFSYIASANPSWGWLGLIMFFFIFDVLGGASAVALIAPPEDFVDGLRVVSHPGRIVVLGIVNYLELVVYFGAIYAISPQDLMPCGQGAYWYSPGLSGLYFSTITQMTIGYGDIQPLGWLRAIACVQALCGLGVLVLLIGQFVSALPKVIAVDEAVKIAERHRLLRPAVALAEKAANAALEGKIEEARSFWLQAHDLFAKIGMKPELDKVQGWIDELSNP